MTGFWLAFSLVFSPLAWSHSDDMLKDIKPPHGGILAVSGGYHLELVLAPKQVQVYVTDHAMHPSDIQGASGDATVMVGAKAQKVTLTLKDDHLEGAATVPADKAVTAMVNIKLRDSEEGARFSRPVDAHSEHKHH